MIPPRDISLEAVQLTIARMTAFRQEQALSQCYEGRHSLHFFRRNVPR
jgi:hypothetical protein